MAAVSSAPIPFVCTDDVLGWEIVLSCDTEP